MEPSDQVSLRQELVEMRHELQTCIQRHKSESRMQALRQEQDAQRMARLEDIIAGLVSMCSAVPAFMLRMIRRDAPGALQPDSVNSGTPDMGNPQHVVGQLTPPSSGKGNRKLGASASVSCGVVLMREGSVTSQFPGSRLVDATAVAAGNETCLQSNCGIQGDALMSGYLDDFASWCNPDDSGA